MLQPHRLLCDEYLMGVRFENLEKKKQNTDKKNQRKKRRTYGGRGGRGRGRGGYRVIM